MPLKEQIRTKGSENKGGTKGQLGVLRGRKQIRPSDRAENPTQKDNLMWINSQQLAPNGEPAPPTCWGWRTGGAASTDETREEDQPESNSGTQQGLDLGRVRGR